MDIGIFRRSKKVFVAWVLSPILLAMVVQLGSICLCMRANRMLSRNKDMLEAVNRLYYSSSRSEVAIESTKDERRRIPEATQEVSGWINDIASGSDFQIETLSVDKADSPLPQVKQSKAKSGCPPAGITDGLPSITITLKGHGGYLSVTRFIRDIESYSPMIRVQNADITEEVYGKTDSYRCNLVFRIYTLKS